MAIPVTPVRIASDGLEIEVPLESSLLPEMILRLDSPNEVSVFAEVQAVEVVANALRVSLAVLQGQAGLSMSSAHILDDDALREEVHRFTGQRQALLLTLSDSLSLDVSRLGTLSVVSGEPFESKFQATLGLMQGLMQYRRLLVLDPLGVFEEEDGVLLLQAGEDVKLSIQSVGLSRFLDQVAKTLPEPVQSDALQVLMRHSPVSPDFIPFKRFLNLDKTEDGAVKSALLYNLYEIYGQHIFADQPDEEFDLGAIETQMTVLDMSTLTEPWKTLFYEQVLTEWLRESALDLVPVLIYPEQYLESLAEWAPKAEAQGLTILALVSPYEGEDLTTLADNWLEVLEDGRVEIRGRLTWEIPVRVTLEDLHQMAESRMASLMSEHTPQGEDLSFPVEEDAFRFDLSKPQAIEPPAPAATTWQELGWQPPAETAGPTPVSHADEDVPVFDSILGDVRALESQAAPSPASPMPSPMPASLESTLTAGDEELDFAFDDWDGTDNDTSSEAVPSPMKGALMNESFAEPETGSGWDAPDEAQSGPITAGAAAEPPPVQDEVPVYQTRQLAQEVSPDSSGNDFNVGDRVRHPKHGVGIIQKKIPMESSFILNIQFETLGKCLVDPKLAPLEKV